MRECINLYRSIYASARHVMESVGCLWVEEQQKHASYKEDQEDENEPKCNRHREQRGKT